MSERFTLPQTYRTAAGDLTIRRFTPGDAAAAAELDVLLFPSHPWPAEMFAAEAQSSYARYLAVSDATGRLVGTAGVALFSPIADVQTIGVHPDYAGMGLGRHLMGLLEHTARTELAAEATMLEVAATNQAAIGLYSSLGYHHIHTRANYYPGGIDGHIMRKDLTDPTASGATTAADQPNPLDPAQEPLVLGIESSCDETGIGIVRGSTVLANAIATSMHQHAAYGGVIPEIAARAHLEQFIPVLDQALADAGVTLAEVDAIAVTAGPGLIGALMVGVAGAKALAHATGKPLYGINHLVAHVCAATADGVDIPRHTGALLVSGGHTEILKVGALTRDLELLGATRDDAAGEAYDKVARIIGLGYPGGPVIDKAAQQGNPTAFKFPRGMTARKFMGTAAEPGPDRYNFSFSGLKTAVARCVEGFEARGEELPINDICASFQEAVVDVLTDKAVKACTENGLTNLILAGGVAANSRLRELLDERCAEAGITLLTPQLNLCTDNGAMVALLGAALVAEGVPASGLDFTAVSTLPVDTVSQPA